MDLDPPVSKSHTSNPHSFAYTSARDRWPAIITGAIDDVHRSVSALLATPTKDDPSGLIEPKISEGKTIISQLAGLKYELQHNRPLERLLDDGEADVKLYNDELKLRASEHPDKVVKWHDVEWLFSECYLYRRINSFFSTSSHWKTYDPFARQKLGTFKSSRTAVVELAAKYKEIILAAEAAAAAAAGAGAGAGAGGRDEATEKVKEKILFKEMAEICLWGNATDLSLLTNLTYEDLQKLQGSQAAKSREKSVLVNDLDKVFEVLYARKVESGGGRVDIVLDNAGFELFVDLVLAGYLLATGLAGEVILHPKSIPWFVSDVLPKDFAELLSAVQDPRAFYEADTAGEHHHHHHHHHHQPLSQKEEEDIKFLFNHWSKLHTEGQLILRPNRFWTHAGSFWRLPKYGPEILQDLKKGENGESGSELVIFKGDLNYRKLVGDGEWDPTTPFQKAIGPLGASSGLRVLALRTCKADTVVGLAPGQDEEIRRTTEAAEGGSPDPKARKWAWNGKWAVVQFSDGKA